MREQRIYKERLKISKAQFTLIDHEDAMVATVYKVTQPGGEEFILKICSRSGDYFREAYFLNHFAGKIPVPRIIQVVPPEADVHGAILMAFLSGELLKKETLTEKLCRETGSLLACIHRDPVKGYGDLTAHGQLTLDPRIPFFQKFEEGLEECQNHLPSSLIEKCREYYEKHAEILLSTDGPCVIHRDFRPGNLIVSDGDVQGVIDWSSARGGFAEEDFCPLEFGEWSNNSSYKEAFLEGYASIRKVPEYGRMMPFLRLSRAIGAIGFTVKRGTWEGKGAKIYQFNRQHLEAFLKD